MLFLPTGFGFANRSFEGGGLWSWRRSLACPSLAWLLRVSPLNLDAGRVLVPSLDLGGLGSVSFLLFILCAPNN